MDIKYIIIFVLIFLLYSCKRDIAGCNDIEATNWSQKANLNDGSCKYLPLILDPSFETWSDWTTYSGNGYSASAGLSSVGDGFMPTHGKSFFIAIPSVNKTNGTLTKQFLSANKHYKGFYFDYSYTAVAGADSVLSAYAVVGASFGQSNLISWIKTVYETPNSFQGFPSITVRKRDEYVELPYSDETGIGTFGILTSVSKGTFTFQVDNIREVPR